MNGKEWRTGLRMELEEFVDAYVSVAALFGGKPTTPRMQVLLAIDL